MLILKEFNTEDICTYLDNLKNTDAKFLVQFAGSGYVFPLSQEQIIKDINDKNRRLYKFIDVTKNIIIGYCQITGFDWNNNTCSIGRVLINERFKGSGYSYKMLHQLLSLINEVFKLQEVSLRVFSFNSPAIKCYTKLGFIVQCSEDKYFNQIDETWECLTMIKKVTKNDN